MRGADVWVTSFSSIRTLARPHFGSSYFVFKGILSQDLPHWPSTNPQHGVWLELDSACLLLHDLSINEEATEWSVLVPGPSHYQVWFCFILFHEKVQCASR